MAYLQGVEPSKSGQPKKIEVKDSFQIFETSSTFQTVLPIQSAQVSSTMLRYTTITRTNIVRPSQPEGCCFCSALENELPPTSVKPLCLSNKSVEHQQQRLQRHHASNSSNSEQQALPYHLAPTTWTPELSSPKKLLKRHNIQYNDDELVCDSCERSKATKQYNRAPQQRAERPHQSVHTDFVCPIAPISFGAERYFFTFTDDYTRITKTYIAERKSKWLKSLMAFYNLIRTRTGLNRPIQRLRSDYGSELQSRKVDKWLTNY